MSIKSEILTLQYIRMDLGMKIADIKHTIKATKRMFPGSKDIESIERALSDFRELYDEVSHELQTNTDYTRAYPALCAIAMDEDVKVALLGKVVEDEETQKECGTQ